MANPDLLPGNRFRAYRGSGATAEFVCLATSVTLTITNAFEDATVADCDGPTEIPTRKSIKSSTSWGGRFAGSIAADHLDDFRTDAANETAVPYEFRVDRNAAGGKWAGNVHIENSEVAKNNNGIVSFTAQFRGDGALDWTAAAWARSIPSASWCARPSAGARATSSSGSARWPSLSALAVPASARSWPGSQSTASA